MNEPHLVILGDLVCELLPDVDLLFTLPSADGVAFRLDACSVVLIHGRRRRSDESHSLELDTVFATQHGPSTLASTIGATAIFPGRSFE